MLSVERQMQDFVEASDALMTVLRSFLRGTEQRDYSVPSIALDEATRRYTAAKAALQATGA